MYQMEFRPSMVLFVLPKKKTVPGVSKGVRSMEVGGVPQNATEHIHGPWMGTSHTTQSSVIPTPRSRFCFWDWVF